MNAYRPGLSMRNVTFQVIEGVDKGRVFRDLQIPVSIGREEGNGLRLNDERVSRFHAKVQFDGDDVIITDLDSTNGTRINGDPVQIRRLQAGDRVAVGRSVMIYGTQEEIRDRIQAMRTQPGKTKLPDSLTVPESAAVTDPAALLLDSSEAQPSDRFWASVSHPPALPQRLSASQAARLTEILDFLHRGIATAADGIRVPEAGDRISMPLADWLKVQAVQSLLAHYARSVAEPEGEG